MANAAAMAQLMAAKKTAASATNATVIPNVKTVQETTATVMTALQKKNSATAEDVTSLQ